MKITPTIIKLLILATCATAQTNSLTPEKSAAFDKYIERAKSKFRAASSVHIKTWVNSGETRCQGYIGGHTNVIAYLPLREQLLDVHLFDKDGTEFPKNCFECNFGQPLKPDKNLLAGLFVEFDGFRAHSRKLDFSNGCYEFWDFEIAKNFRIKKPGEYRFQVQARLFTKDTNGVFQPFKLPPVETKVSISEDMLK